MSILILTPPLRFDFCSAGRRNGGPGDPAGRGAHFIQRQVPFSKTSVLP